MENDSFAKKLIDHDARFDQIEAKLDNVVTNDNFLTHMDRMMVILQRLDQERVFTNQTIERLQKVQDEQQKTIDHIKQVLKIA